MLRVRRNEVKNRQKCQLDKKVLVVCVVDLESELGLDILVKEPESQDGEGGVAKVVHGDECLIQRCLQAKNMEKQTKTMVLFTPSAASHEKMYTLKEAMQNTEFTKVLDIDSIYTMVPRCQVEVCPLPSPFMVW